MVVVICNTAKKANDEPRDFIDSRILVETPDINPILRYSLVNNPWDVQPPGDFHINTPNY